MAFGGAQAGLNYVRSQQQLSPQDRTTSRLTQESKQKSDYGWGPSTVTKNPDGTQTITATKADGTPVGTITVNPDGSYSNYDANGRGATFDANGQMVQGTEKVEGAAAGLYSATGLPGVSDIRGVTDKLGITTPNP